MMDWEFRCDRDRTRDVYIFWLSRVIPILESQGKSLSIWLAPSMRTKYTRRVFGAYLWEQWVKLCVSTGSGWSNVFSCVCQCQSNHEPSCMIRELWWEQSFWGGIKRSGMKRYVWIWARSSELFFSLFVEMYSSLALFSFFFRHGAGLCVRDPLCGSSSWKVRVMFSIGLLLYCAFYAKMIDLVAHSFFFFFCFIWNGRRTLLATKGKM